MTGTKVPLWDLGIVSLFGIMARILAGSCPALLQFGVAVGSLRHPNFPSSLRSVSLCRFFDRNKADPFLGPRHVAEAFFFIVAIGVASSCILLVERPFMQSSLHSVQSSMARILLCGRVDLRVKSCQSRSILKALGSRSPRIHAVFCLSFSSDQSAWSLSIL